MALTLRPLKDADVPAVSALARKIWLAHYPDIISVAQIEHMLADQYSPEALRRQIREGQAFTLAFEGEEMAGYLAMLPEGESRYFLKKFYVDTARHRRGIGQALFDHVMAQLSPSAKQIRLMVNRMNYKPINFYFRNGFVIDGLEDTPCGGGYFMNDFRMIKRLR